MSIAVEVCVSGQAEAMAAEAAGVDHLELCTWPACGGTTPGTGQLVQAGRKLRTPLRVLVRPTPGHFHYAPAEQEEMLEDVKAIRQLLPTAGIVIGALDENGLPDIAFMQQVMAFCTDAEVTFHRAIDHAADPLRALDMCMDLGVQRILTSGGHIQALDGANVLARMVSMAGDRIRIAAAGGILPGHVVELAKRTGAHEIHFAARRPATHAPRGIAMSSTDDRSWDTEPDVEKITAMLEALSATGLR